MHNLCRLKLSRWMLCFVLVLQVQVLWAEDVKETKPVETPSVEKPSLEEQAAAAEVFLENAITASQEAIDEAGEEWIQAEADRLMAWSTRRKLKMMAVAANWPGGALWHTAFHTSYTTRYLLLRSCKSSSEFAKYLKLDKKQQGIVEELELIELLKPQNDQPDLEVIAPGYFSFLNEEQMLKLDLMAMQYDGYWVLTRKSVAKRLKLSKETQKKIAVAIWQAREDLVMPRFRHEFASPLPDDWKYDSVRYNGSVTTYTNIEIINQMTDEECERFLKMIMQDKTPGKVHEELRAMVSLPDGVMNLRQRQEE